MCNFKKIKTIIILSLIFQLTGCALLEDKMQCGTDTKPGFNLICNNTPKVASEGVGILLKGGNIIFLPDSPTDKAALYDIQKRRFYNFKLGEAVPDLRMKVQKLEVKDLSISDRLLSGHFPQLEKTDKVVDLSKNKQKWNALLTAVGGTDNPHFLNLLYELKITNILSFEITKLKDGNFLLSGGMDKEHHVINKAFLYMPSRQIIKNVSDMHVARLGHKATLLPDGQVLITGGDNGNKINEIAELYNPLTQKFELLTTKSKPFSYHNATLLNDGKILLYGGLANEEYNKTKVVKKCSVGKEAQIYNPTLKTFQSAPEMTIGRSRAKDFLLGNNQILIVGGFSFNSDCDSKALNSAELFIL